MRNMIPAVGPCSLLSAADCQSLTLLLFDGQENSLNKMQVVVPFVSIVFNAMEWVSHTLHAFMDS